MPRLPTLEPVGERIDRLENFSGEKKTEAILLAPARRTMSFETTFVLEFSWPSRAFDEPRKADENHGANERHDDRANRGCRSHTHFSE
jgi:hypothetical protein